MMRRLALILFVLAAAAAPGWASAQPLKKPMLREKPSEWTQASSAAFAFTTSENVVAFQCALGDEPFLACDPDASPPAGRQQYAGLEEGAYLFHVRVVDGGGNASMPRTHSWTVDRTPPALSAPGDVGAAATSAAGAVVDYPLPVATDALDSAPLVACSPAPGSVFPIGTTAVTCVPSDHAGNVGAPASFAVEVGDTTPPTLRPYPDIVVQQEDSTGATVAYDPWPTATDAVDGNVPAVCSPSSPAGAPQFFALADSPVSVVCTAQDSSGNTSAPVALFRVIVNAGPAPATPQITARPLERANVATADFAFSTSGDVTTTCRLSGPSPAGPEPCTAAKTYTGLADGAYVFTIEVRDATIGTVSQAAYAWEVDTTPPDPAGSFAGRARAGRVTLTWTAPVASDFARVRIARQRGNGAWKRLADLTGATQFTDRTVANDVLYRYRIVSYDTAGNASSPHYTRERPSRLFAPEWDAVHTRPPLVAWTAVRRATYYNIQLWRNGRKVLSRWPGRARYQLPATWRFGRRSYALSEGRYTLYVWPGFGGKAAARYGPLLGWTAFRIG